MAMFDHRVMAGFTVSTARQLDSEHVIND